MFRVALLATAASAIHILAPAGDPECKLGHRSFGTVETEIEVCCPAYCGKCDDYAGCESVNAQDSANACCASKVRAKSCENNASDPYCLKSCDGKSAPCSLGVAPKFEAPEETTAAADCGEAVGEFKEGCKAAVEAVDADQWKGVKERAAAQSEEANAKHARNMDAGAVGGSETL